MATQESLEALGVDYGDGEGESPDEYPIRASNTKSRRRSKSSRRG